MPLNSKTHNSNHQYYKVNYITEITQSKPHSWGNERTH